MEEFTQICQAKFVISLWHDFPSPEIKKEKERKESEVAQSCPTLCYSHGLQPTRFLHPWDFPGKNTGVGCHFLLQEIFLTQGLNPGLLHCRQTLYCLSLQGSPERFFFFLKFSLRLYKVSKAKKSMIIYVYINHQAKFIGTRPILQTSLNLVIFGKNDGDFREKKMFQ